MIRKLEYTDRLGVTKIAHAYEIPSGTVGGQVPNIDIACLEDSDYLFDIDNGYIDSDGNATKKLENQLKTIERVNEGTWEFIVSNISRLDKKPLRGGRSRVIPTYYDVSGQISGFITGIGDGEDCNIIKIDQEREPDIMSKDLFISTMDGFTIGDSEGRTSEIDYTNILNPVNQDNVNNYYPVLNHGYFYDGEEEYYLYGNKQTEILAGQDAEQLDGYVYFSLSGQPNTIAPVFINIQQENMQDLMGNINISDFDVYNKNSHRERIDGISVTFTHDLASLMPFVYIVLDSGEIVLPTVTILTLNRIQVDVGIDTHGWVNVIRPNKNFRIYDITNPNEQVIDHNMGTTDVFGLTNTTDEIGIPQIEIVDANTIKLTAHGAYGTFMLINMEAYTYQEDVSSFVSGTINHALDIPLDADDIEYYVDPWVFCVTSGATVEIVEPDEVTHVDGNNTYIDFDSTTFDGTVYILDFYRFNETSALFDGTNNINTDYFAFEEGSYYGNQGMATPIHRMYPIPDNQKQLVCLDQFEDVRELDFLTGYYSGTVYPDEPVYITTTNEVVVPSGMMYNSSGELANIIINYEKDKDFAYEFRFRGTDASPVTWYNTDRIIAIQTEVLDPDTIDIIPDENNVHMQDSFTRIFGGNIDTMHIASGVAGDYTYGPPITSMNLTTFTTDEAGIALSGETVSIDTRRNLYAGYEGTQYTIDNDYDISIVDNTSGIFVDIPENILSGILGEETISTLSIFDEIIFTEVTSAIDIFDDNGYLFTTVSGLSTYRIPFKGSVYDEANDTLVHQYDMTTDVFGTTSNILGFHNDPAYDKISKMNVKAYIAGTSASGAIDILIYPIDRADSYGLVDNDETPNTMISSVDIFNEEVTLVSGIVPTVSTIDIVENDIYNASSGIMERTAPSSNITGVYKIDDKYIVYHGSGYIADILRYDEADSLPASLDIGEYYGDN